MKLIKKQVALASISFFLQQLQQQQQQREKITK